MKINETHIDSMIRVFASVLLLYLGFGGELDGTLAVTAGVSGVIFLLSGVAGFCPPYALFMFSGRKRKSSIQGARVQLSCCA